MTFSGWTALPAGTSAAAIAAYWLWEAGARRAEFEAALAAWTIPAPTLPAGYVDASARLTGDGTTDDTAALQALLDDLAGGETVFFPAGTYRIDGQVAFAKAVALVGEAGTIFDCSGAAAKLGGGTWDQRIVFAINFAGSPGSPIAGVSVTGIEIAGEGAFNGTYGAEPHITLIHAAYLDGFALSRCNLHDATHGITLVGCTGAIVEDSVFDTIMYTSLGYGVNVSTWCDDTTIRRCFFIGDGRHGVTHGGSHTVTAAEWPGASLIEDCYFADMQSYAIDAHENSAGPFIIRNNVIVNSYGGITIRGATYGTTVTGNAILDSLVGGYYSNRIYSDAIDTNDPQTPDRTYLDEFGFSLGGPVDHRDIFTKNVVSVSAQILLLKWSNARIADNVLVYTREVSPPVIDAGTFTPTGTYEVVDNIYARPVSGDILLNTGHHVTTVSENTYVPGYVLAAGPAAFTVSPADPVTGEAVTFTDATPGSPPDWEWDFGDGAGSAAQHPTHAYPTAGVYPVTLTADTTTATQTVTVRPGVSYGGARLSEADLAPLDHDPIANATRTKVGSVRLQGSPVSRRAWTINALADDHAEIEALAALPGQHLTLNINGVEYPGVMIRPPMLETQLTPAAWAYQIGFVQETRHA